VKEQEVILNKKTNGKNGSFKKGEMREKLAKTTKTFQEDSIINNGEQIKNKNVENNGDSTKK
jgi:hypothetical protein